MDDIKKVLAFIIVFLFFTSTGHSQDSALRIEIQPKQKSVKNGEEVSVVTKIINTSNKDQHLQVWSCSYYDNWIVNSPFVKLNAWPCRKNFVHEVVLKPGKTYENKLSLKIIVPADKNMLEKIIFKLGFKTFIKPATGDIKPKEIPVIWSNPVTIMIKEQKEGL